MSASAPVFDIQTLSTHDGPGIRTVVFLQGCPLRCTWCCNPEGQSAGGQLRWRAVRCRGCKACVAACPQGAVAGDTPRPVFDRTKCAGCTQRDCIAACPASALDVVGQVMQAQDVLLTLKKDLRLYWNSGGGVTLSGGEPLLYPEFVAEVAAGLARVGVGTALETCGAWDSDSAQAALEACALVYFDVKSLNEKTHEKFTGRSNRGILRNLAMLANRCPSRVCISVPVIPGLNDTLAEVLDIGQHVVQLGLSKLRLLPYHRLGLAKYEGLGLTYAHPCDRQVDMELLSEMARRLRSQGLSVTS